MNTIYARNMPFPEPVVKTKKALEGITEGQTTLLVPEEPDCRSAGGCPHRREGIGSESFLLVSGNNVARNSKTPIM